MKRRISIPSIIALAGALLLGGWGSVFVVPAMAQQTAAPAAPAAPAPSGGPLDDRIRQLEERIQDLQTVIGTLQSFVGNGAAAAAPGGAPPPGGQPAGAGAGAGAPSEVSIRVLALETQIRALTGQMEQITERLGRMESGAGAGAPLPGPVRQALPQELQPGSPAANPLAPPPAPGPGANPVLPGQAQQAPAPQFGTTASPPLSANPFDQAPIHPSARTQAQPPGQLLPPFAGLPGGGEGPRAMYDASYQNFLRNDFAAAENGFRSFISTYPADQLTSNAYYWLGRSHFERKQFEPAAKSFLAGYKKNKKSSIAPDSLLHLGLSLAQLGEKDAACSTLAAVAKQFPDASEKIKQDAADAIKRGRC